MDTLTLAYIVGIAVTTLIFVLVRIPQVGKDDSMGTVLTVLAGFVCGVIWPVYVPAVGIRTLVNIIRKAVESG